MRIVYCNPANTSVKLYGRLPGKGYHFIAPPFSELIAHIGADVLIEEAQPYSDEYDSHPYGKDYWNLLSGQALPQLGRPVQQGDELILFSIPHLFRTLYEDFSGVMERLTDRRIVLHFWREGLSLDFSDPLVHRQIAVFRALNGFVIHREEVARLTAVRLQEKWGKK